MSQWKPNATVAAIIERDGRFLMVEEQTSKGLRFNQPAGHLEHGETLEEAAVRETAEETGWRFTPEQLVGIYMVDRDKTSDITYLRFAYCGPAEPPQGTPRLDDGIVAAHWLTYDEIAALQPRLRSPVILQCLQDYLAGQRFPLSLVRHQR
nr:NUDIX hydrolase [Chromobacterium sp. ASV5]